MFGAAGCTALLVTQLFHGADSFSAASPGVAEPVRSAPGPANSALAAPGALAATAPAASTARRRVYPYSIIPGGVSGPDELARVIKTDPVVAAHYASFNVGAAKAYTVTTPRAVYVSYRKGDRVYWTAKKLMLAKGEVLLSDGQNEMRARCANRISDVPQLPVETNGPSESELDVPVEVAQELEEDTGLLNASFPMEENTAVSRLTALVQDQPVFADNTGFRNTANLNGQFSDDNGILANFVPGFAGYGSGVETPGAGTTAPADGGSGGEPLPPVATLPVTESPQPGPVPTAPPNAAPAPPVKEEGGIREEISEPPRTPPPTDAPRPQPAPQPEPGPGPGPGPESPEFVPHPPAPPGTQVDIDIGTPKGDVPEPGSWWLMGVALAALAAGRKSKASAKRCGS
ncbi:MAG: PEP-CTERM sorting domain-containing protein [Telluria sp.]